MKDKHHRTCGWVLSLSDGFDHPMDDYEQIQIAKAAAMVCNQMVFSLSQILRTADDNENLGDILISRESMAASMATVGNNVLQEIRSNGVVDYVGAGNATVCIYPAPGKNAYSLDVIAVGDCLAFIFHPSKQSQSTEIIQIVSRPKLFLVHTNPVTGAKEYQPFSATRMMNVAETNSGKDNKAAWWMIDHIHCENIESGAMIFLMSDGCWEKFSEEWIEIEPNPDADNEHPSMVPKLDVAAIASCLQQCHGNIQSQIIQEKGDNAGQCGIQYYVSALRNEVLVRAEMKRKMLHNALETCRAYRNSSSFDENRFVHVDAETGKRRFVSWKDCQESFSLEIIPIQVRNAVQYIIQVEKFSEDVPFITVLDHKPSLGDDCTILGFALPSSVGEQIVEDLVEIRAHTTKSDGRDTFYHNMLYHSQIPEPNVTEQDICGILDQVQLKKYNFLLNDCSIHNDYVIHRGDDLCKTFLPKYPVEWIHRTKKAIKKYSKKVTGQPINNHPS